MKMNDNTSIAIVLSILFISISGCLVGTVHENNKVEIEKEKTKQMTIQARIDSLKITTSNAN